MNRALVIIVVVGALVLIWAALYFPNESSAPRADQRTPVEAPPSAPAPAPAPTQPESPPPPTPAPQRPAAVQPAPSEERAAAAAPQEMRPERMGPVDELKAAYENDPRDAEAGAMEERIRGHIEGVENASELVRKVTCVKSVCKLELRWTPALKEAYMGAMMNLVARASQKLAADPIGADDGQAVRPIDVYVSRIEPPYTPAALPPASEAP